MGIDIYAKWRGQTKKEEEVQITGFSTVSGNVGYLREAYHGEPYATKVLVAEAFDAEDGSVGIPAETLKERLPEVLDLVERREREVYKTTDEKQIQQVKDSFIAFVDLCEKKEEELGEPCQITASY